jgi:hypothetical protein
VQRETREMSWWHLGKALRQSNIVTFLNKVADSECIFGSISRSESLVGHVKEWEEFFLL